MTYRNDENISSVVIQFLTLSLHPRCLINNKWLNWWIRSVHRKWIRGVFFGMVDGLVVWEGGGDLDRDCGEIPSLPHQSFRFRLITDQRSFSVENNNYSVESWRKRKFDVISDFYFLIPRIYYIMFRESVVIVKNNNFESSMVILVLRSSELKRVV